MTDRDLMLQALNALEELLKATPWADHPKEAYSAERVHKALWLRLAQPEQEPVATVQCIKGITIDPVTGNVGIGTPAQPAQQEPVYHLRQFGDVTEEQLDRYMETGDINPQPAPVQEPVAIDWDTKTDTPIMGYTTPPAAQPAMFGPMGTVGDLFDKHVIANGNLKKEWIVYLEKNT